MTPRNIQIQASDLQASLPDKARHDLTCSLALQWHYRILQALALDEDIPDKPDDKTIPKYKQIAKVGDSLL
jgi:hypothetical protein